MFHTQQLIILVYAGSHKKTSMFIEPITSNSIILATCKLKTKLSSGHDDISSKLLKETIFHIVHPITHIINMSSHTGIVPDQLKIAKVVPIYKASDNSLLNNYRPISLLPIFSKLLEKIMFDKVMNFLNKNNILYEHQYGFRAKHSSIQPIIHVLITVQMPTIRTKIGFHASCFM